MNQTIDTAPAPLTPAEGAAALEWIERGESSLRQLAAQLDLAADELLDILTRPHVAAFIEAAETLLHIRTSILARYDDADARQSLVEIAKNPEAEHAVRLRAAITILQGPPPRRSAPATPTVPGGPRPDRSSSRSTPAPTSAQPPPANNHRAEPPLTPPTSDTPTRLHRAAGAPFAHHERRAASNPDARIEPRLPRPAASPATSGRPP